MAATNGTGLHGLCPRPFLQAENFPSEGGFLEGRFCQPYTSPQGTGNCCIPCPITSWVYPEDFESKTDAANWINVAALLGNLFLLTSFAVLPVKYTHRHYLSICLCIAVAFMELAFIIPLGKRPEQCFNEITPNDMHSSGTCAITGAFLLFGGWAAVMWVFYRALSLHLQICWEVVPGKKFFYSALAVGWGIPAVALTLALTLTGVSYRFGTVCHINHDKSLQDFWGPLLAFAAASLVIQVVTLIYCIQVYVRSLFDDSAPTTETSGHLPSHVGSTRAASARQAYRRVKRVIALQWRGVAIVLLVIAFVVFFSIIFVSMDSNLKAATNNNAAKLEPWLLCLALGLGEREPCLKYVEGIVMSEATIMGVLVCLASTGFFCVIFLGRWSMLAGWRDIIKTRLLNRGEFVSAEARRLSHDHRAYEMLSGPTGVLKVPESSYPSPKESWPSPTSDKMNPLGQNATFDRDYYEADGKKYTTPVTSFSSPRPPSSTANKTWDPSSTYARGNGRY